MKHIIRTLMVITCILAYATPNTSYAIREPRPQTIDGRLKTLVYNADEVFKFTGYFYYQSIIEFEEGEAIQNLSVGLPHFWQIQQVGHRIFIKPVSNTAEEATTNMTVITNKRTYFFELHADEAENINEQGIPFIVRFVYPETEKTGEIEQVNRSRIITNTKNLNYNYTISGPENISPIKIYDDQVFTYFEFRENAPIPAFFEVNSDGYESVVNYRIEDGILVVEKIVSQFTLRYGDDIACVYNESKPLKLKKED